MKVRVGFTTVECETDFLRSFRLTTSSSWGVCCCHKVRDTTSNVLTSFSGRKSKLSSAVAVWFLFVGEAQPEILAPWLIFCCWDLWKDYEAGWFVVVSKEVIETSYPTPDTAQATV